MAVRITAMSIVSSRHCVIATRSFHGCAWATRPQLFRPQNGRQLPLSQPFTPNPNPRQPSFCTRAAAQVTAVEEARGGVLAHQTQNVVNLLEERGLIESLTHQDLRSACSNPSTKPLKVYCGFDPTAESLHLGNLLGIIVLTWFQKCGHVPVALVGGATARIGDPSGKSVERPVLDEETIRKNSDGITTILEQILGRENQTLEENQTLPRFALIMNNYDWWKEFSLLDFLRDVGKYARVGTMMAKESVKKRLQSDEGMSFTEFSYQLLQGYDFLYLFKNEGVSVQIGGSDQWGNITAGTELIRKVLQQDGAYGLTFPLLLKSDGTKFGKSEEGAIWLSPDMLSPYKFYQHFIGTADADVIVFLKKLTFLSMEEILNLEEGMRQPGYVPNTVQRKLAEEVTRFVHGEEGLKEALKATEALAPGAKTRLDWRTIDAIAKDVPSFSLSYDEVLNTSLVDLSVKAGLLETKAAVRRLIRQGGLYLNNERVENEGKIIEGFDIVDDKMLLLSAGKKNKMVVRID
uniref:Tyrosine--tRNA ligase n=1 Tax=Araucaria cunninghamii TaxID=56994 RepID=A0A0D6R8W8_ARACU